MQHIQLLTFALALGTPAVVYGQLVWSDVTSSTGLQGGEGTFYGEGQDSQGTCSFSANFANTNKLPWSTGTDLTVAMNDAQFADSAACGMCIRFRGTGSGLGTTPIPSSWTNALVNNRCPECSKGDVDLAAAGDGRWKIQWYAVPCEVGNTPLQYSIVVSSYYWFSMVVSNTRVPVTGVSVNIGGSWLPLKRTNNNQWAYYNTNGPWQSNFPMGVRVTSITGQTVEDAVTSPTGNAGKVQFSASGSSSTSAVPATPSAVTASPPVGASTQAAAVPPPVASTPPPVQAAVAQVPPPVSQSPPAPLTTSGGFYVESNQQCGGTGGACNDKPYTSAPCADAAWSAATCRNPNYACVRASPQLWTCVPGAAGTPPVGAQRLAASPPVGAQSVAASPPVASASVSPPPTPATSTPPVTSTSTPLPSSTPPAATPPVSGSTPAPYPPVSTSTPAPTPPVSSSTQAAAQSYGIQASTSVSPTPTPPSAASQTQAASPPPSPIAQSSDASQSQGSASKSIAIAAGGQCGGTSSCDPAGQSTDKVSCNNGPWAGAYCPSSYTCAAAPGPLVWLCTQSSTATAGRRLLQ